MTILQNFYVESYLGTTEPQTNHSEYSPPIEALNLIVNSKSQPTELHNLTIGVTCTVEAKEKLAIILFCGFYFLVLMRFDMTFDVMLSDDSSFGKVTNLCINQNVSFSLLLVTFSMKANF